MTNAFIAFGAALLAGAATIAVAQPPAQPPVPPRAPAPPMRAPMQPPATRAEATAAVRTRFAAIDANKDGFVTREELPRPASMPMVRSGGPDMLFGEMDADKNGQISRAEFDAFHSGPNRMTMIDGGAERRVTIIRREGTGGPMGGMRGMPGMRAPGALGLGMLFDRVDANNDGRLSSAEVDAAALARFDRVDDNHDGTISPEERQAHAPRRMAMRWRQDRFDRMPAPPPPMPAQ